MVKMNNSTNSGKHADPPYLIGNTHVRKRGELSRFLGV